MRAVLGLINLYTAERSSVEKTIKYLQKQNLDLIVPMHCTGFTAQRKMEQSLDTQVEIGEVGMNFNF